MPRGRPRRKTKKPQRKSQTFMNDSVPTNQSTQSEEVLDALSNRLGTIDYSNLQVLRQPFYSRQKYPLAGVSSLYFFGSGVGQSGTTLQDTNMPKAGSFGQQSMLIKSLSLSAYLETDDTTLWAGTDATASASDVVAGFLQAGVLKFVIGAKNYLTAPLPFQLLPPEGQPPTVAKSNLSVMTGAVSGAAMTGIVTQIGPCPRASQTRLRRNVFFFDPAILIGPEQQFTVELSYDSGVVPVIATSVANGTTNPWWVEAMFDGCLVRPVQ